MIAEEAIEVPCGREVRESRGNAIDDCYRGVDADVGEPEEGEGRGEDGVSDYQKSLVSGLSGLIAGMRGVDDDDDTDPAAFGTVGGGAGGGGG